MEKIHSLPLVLFRSLDTKEKIEAGNLLLLAVLTALLETLGVASIMPFMTLLSDPSVVNENHILHRIYLLSVSVGVRNQEDFAVVSAIVLFIILLAALSVKALFSYVYLRFVLLREYSIGKRLLSRYLHQPYQNFLVRSSKDISKVILSEVNQMVRGGFMPLITIIFNGFGAILIFALLLLIDPIIALTVFALIAIIYSVVLWISRRYLSRIGKERLDANEGRFKMVDEAFGSPKELKLYCLENFYLERFSDYSQVYAERQAAAQAISHLPRFALEATAFGAILLALSFLMMGGASLASVLPLLTLYVFAGYRILPNLQQIYASISQLRFSSSTIMAMHKDLTRLEKEKLLYSSRGPLTINEAIKIDGVTYRYPDTVRDVVCDVTLTIPARCKVGFVGVTGSGKTTIIDILLGLLVPQKGSLRVDGIAIDESNSWHWRQSIGYVPQHIYLADDTLAANIAFGVEATEVDQKAVERAAKIANLHDFIINDLEEKYQTMVGERGIRLSGGQRQRVGIARALYRSPKLLILDEATNALDSVTEEVVMDALRNLRNPITVIFIAHRINTLRGCDRIFVIESGRLIAEGGFEQLKKDNMIFSKMASL